jgi:hypothetical protein
MLSISTFYSTLFYSIIFYNERSNQGRKNNPTYTATGEQHESTNETIKNLLAYMA